MSVPNGSCEQCGSPLNASKIEADGKIACPKCGMRTWARLSPSSNKSNTQNYSTYSPYNSTGGPEVRQTNGVFIFFVIAGCLALFVLLFCAGVFGMMFLVGTNRIDLPKAPVPHAAQATETQTPEAQDEVEPAPPEKKLSALEEFLLREDGSTPPKSLPQARFNLPAPESERRFRNGIDLKEEDPDLLHIAAMDLHKEGEFASGLPLQYWSVVNSKNTDGFYDLACFYSRVGKVDSAIYALQRSTATEGVNLKWILADSDLENVRADTRWPVLAAYLKQCERYWQNVELIKSSIILPENYDGRSPIPVMIGLHGMGDEPAGFVSDYLQPFADELQVAFIAVNGTVAKGPRNFIWSDDVERDEQHIQKVMKGIPGIVPDPSKIGLFGFSQGGIAATSIAARYPDKYLGAIAFSPGGPSFPQVTNYPRHSKHPSQIFIFSFGGKENARTVAIARAFDEDVKKIGCQSILMEYPEVSDHAFPPDFDEKFPVWTRKLLSLQ